MSSWIMEALLLVIVVVPLVILFGYAVFDVIRRHDIGLGAQGMWLIAFCVLPIVGPLVYLVIRPPGMTAQEDALAGDEQEQGGRADRSRGPARPRQADRRGVPSRQGGEPLDRGPVPDLGAGAARRVVLSRRLRSSDGF